MIVNVFVFLGFFFPKRSCTRIGKVFVLLGEVERSSGSVECLHAHDEHMEKKKQESGFYVQEFGVPFMETSAKSGLNVELAFTAVAK